MRFLIDVDFQHVPAEIEPRLRGKIEATFEVMKKLFVRELALHQADHPKMQLEITLEKDGEAL